MNKRSSLFWDIVTKKKPFYNIDCWSNEIEEIVLIRGEKGLGFSILDYQVSNFQKLLFIEKPNA
jgi:hypothetical protein